MKCASVSTSDSLGRRDCGHLKRQGMPRRPRYANGVIDEYLPGRRVRLSRIGRYRIPTTTSSLKHTIPSSQAKRSDPRM